MSPVSNVLVLQIALTGPSKKSIATTACTLKLKLAVVMQVAGWLLQQRAVYPSKKAGSARAELTTRMVCRQQHHPDIIAYIR